MVFEEYQFLRYFIPGSLYVVYTSLIILANLSPKIIDYMSVRPDSIIGIVVAAFGASLIFGYLIYSTYDWSLYNRLAMREGWRKSLTLVEEELKTEEKKKIWQSLSNEKKKAFLDMLYYWSGDTSTNLQTSNVIRGIWSHFNARIVGSFFVPFIAGISIICLHICAGNYLFLWSYSITNSVIGLSIVTISVSLLVGARRPFKEAIRLEFFFLKDKISLNKPEFEKLFSRLLE